MVGRARDRQRALRAQHIPNANVPEPRFQTVNRLSAVLREGVRLFDVAWFGRAQRHQPLALSSRRSQRDDRHDITTSPDDVPLWADPQRLMRTDLIGRLGSIDLPVRAHRLSERASRRNNRSAGRCHGLHQEKASISVSCAVLPGLSLRSSNSPPTAVIDDTPRGGYR